MGEKKKGLTEEAKKKAKAAFTKMRKLLETHTEILQKLEKLERKDIEQDEKIMLIFEYLKQLEKVKQKELEQNGRTRIGFKK